MCSKLREGVTLTSWSLIVALSFSRVFLGELLSSRAHLRFLGYADAASNNPCSSSKNCGKDNLKLRLIFA
jgi:hypothetical protein